jgi:hypothetical protein
VDEGQLKGNHLFTAIFCQSLPINYTTLKLATYLEVALGNTKYHHQDSDITNKRFMFVLSDHGARTTKRDPSVLNKFLESLPINHTTLQLAIYLEEALGNTK